MDLNASSLSGCDQVIEILSKRGLLDRTFITCLHHYQPLATYLTVAAGSIPIYITPTGLSCLATAISEKSALSIGRTEQKTSNLDHLGRAQRTGEFIQQNTTDEISRPALGLMRKMNQGKFESVVKTEHGHASRQYLLHQKIEIAKTEIAQGRSIKIVALDLGFKDLAYFSNTFSKYVGLSPRAYAEQFFRVANQLYSSSDNR